METFRSTIIIIFFAAFTSCNNSNSTDKAIATPDKVLVYAKEPNDSSDYKLLKYDFYLSKGGQLCERKLADAMESSCNCTFEVYYDSSFSIYTGDSTIKKPLNTIVDINSFVWLDSTEYSKDKNKVFYFHGNSDGGNRVIVDKADPLTFKRLCEYRWGIDKNYVFYKGDIVQGVNLKHLQVLYPPDTSYHFIDYIKDDKNVFYETAIVKGADAKTFKVVSGHKWEAEDKNYKYETGRRKE
ncbi:MAG: DKNYY domain-containing protein [Ferruginibacter sp.]|nr:DKNYY domain-containing protein [Ferruginibacter sp.]